MERPIIKDKSVLTYIEYIENKLKDYENSPYAKTYIAIKGQIENFNDQLLKNKIDLFSDKEDRSFDRTKWYFEHVLELNKSLSEIKKLISPEELNEMAKMVEGSSAESHIFNM